MSVKTVTTYYCDRCGSEMHPAPVSGVSEGGSTRVHWSGSIWGMSWNGDCGGRSHSEKRDLCHHCKHALEKFMRMEGDQ